MAKGGIERFPSPGREDSRATSGGIKKAGKLRYSPPTGPTSQGHRGPGLGGYNYGPCGTQGEHDLGTETSGSPGLHGERRGMGTNRKG